MLLLALLQQPRPILLHQLLLPQHELHIPSCVVRLALLRVDDTIEIQRDFVGGLLRFAVAFKSDVGVGDGDLGGFGGYVGGDDGEVDYIASWI